VSVLTWISWQRCFSTVAMASAHSFLRMPAWALNLYRWMVSLNSWIWCTMLPRSLACYAVSCAGGRGFHFLFAQVHQRCLSQYGCVHLFTQQQLLLAQLCLCFLLMLVPPGLTMLHLLGILRAVHSSSDWLKSVFFVCNTTSIFEGPLFPVKGLEL